MTQFDPALLCDVFFADDINKIALLIGQHGGARDSDYVAGLYRLQYDTHQFVVHQFASPPTGQGGVRYNGAQDDRVGVAGHVDIDEVELADLTVKTSVRKPQADTNSVGTAVRGKSLTQFEKPRYRDRKTDVDRILAYDGREGTRRGPHDVTNGEGGTSDATIDRGTNFSITKTDLGLTQLRLRRS
ncbi:hypothetical protein QU42_03415 [Bradyrhizobium sp. UASWS1016]|nr:hypothetical protein QU41_00950 [Bradyrhizobium elkanii]OCX32585.1 hypothetical protein QU42_03415 [Bradyrhizobium sp. UASWS1016]